jgi:glycerophosphoryl diester phosphodiesterase
MRKLLIGILTGCTLLSCKTQQGMNSNKEAVFPAFDREAHRGGRGLMPENTIPAMIHAIDLGVETLEMDTHITGDGKVVLSHDEFINPLFSLTPDGKEISAANAKKYALYKMQYADLAKFDVGSKYYSLFPEQKKMKGAIPLLSDVIDSVQTYLKKTGKKQVFYNIETKSQAKDDNVYNPDPETFVKLLMDVIESKKITPWVVIQSFDKRTLQVLHKKYPNVKTSWLIGNKLSLAANLEDLGFTPFIYSPAFKLVTPELVKDCHARGMKIVPWTANTKEDINTLKSLGVDGIISDYPNLLMN